VIVTLAIGVMGIRAVVKLVKGHKHAYRYTLITLIAGVVVGGIHMAVSRALRGSSMPVDAVVYTTVLTLIVFLIFRIPHIWKLVDFSQSKGNSKDVGGGLAAIVMGGMTLSIPMWMASAHTFNGINYADAFHNTLTVVGWALMLLGVGLLFGAVFTSDQDVSVSAKEKRFPA
jgi:hypothetical protein